MTHLTTLWIHFGSWALAPSTRPAWWFISQSTAIVTLATWRVLWPPGGPSLASDAWGPFTKYLLFRFGYPHVKFQNYLVSFDLFWIVKKMGQ